MRTVVHCINLVDKLFKVWDDKFFSESLSQQHDVVAHTPTKGHNYNEVKKPLKGAL